MGTFVSRFLIGNMSHPPIFSPLDQVHPLMQAPNLRAQTAGNNESGLLQVRSGLLQEGITGIFTVKNLDARLAKHLTKIVAARILTSAQTQTHVNWSAQQQNSQEQLVSSLRTFLCVKRKQRISSLLSAAAATGLACAAAKPPTRSLTESQPPSLLFRPCELTSFPFLLFLSKNPCCHDLFRVRGRKEGQGDSLQPSLNLNKTEQEERPTER